MLLRKELEDMLYAPPKNYEAGWTNVESWVTEDDYKTSELWDTLYDDYGDIEKTEVDAKWNGTINFIEKGEADYEACKARYFACAALAELPLPDEPVNDHFEDNTSPLSADKIHVHPPPPPVAERPHDCT
jgi:hypothetical protein